MQRHKSKQMQSCGKERYGMLKLQIEIKETRSGVEVIAEYTGNNIDTEGITTIGA